MPTKNIWKSSDALKELEGHVFSEYSTDQPQSVRTKHLKGIELFLKTADEKDIDKAWEHIREWVRVRSKYQLNSISARFTSLRNIVKERFGSDSAIYIKTKKEGTTVEEYVKRNENIQATQKNKARNIQRIPLDKINSFIDNALSLGTEEVDIMRKVLAVQLCIGLRFIEVFTANVVMGSTPSEVFISGLAKGTPDMVRTIYRLDWPDLKQLLDAIKVYGRMFNGMDRKKLSTQLSNLEKRTKVLEELGNIEAGRGRTHVARKLYASALYYSMPADKRKRINETQFINDTLGHKTVSATMAYVDYQVDIGGGQPGFVGPRETTAGEEAKKATIRNNIQDKQLAHLSKIKADKEELRKLQDRAHRRKPVKRKTFYSTTNNIDKTKAGPYTG